MQAYTELTPPTAVTHSLTLPFTSADATNLIIAKTSLLQIFRIQDVTVELAEETANGTVTEITTEQTSNEESGFDTSFIVADSVQRSAPATTQKLVLIAEYSLAGTITSLARLKTPDSLSGGESLLLSFRDAKLSLVKWDPARRGISTISIHYYENEASETSPWDPLPNETVNYLLADPQSKCAALKFGARNLAILPFRQGDEDEAMGDWDEELDGPQPAAVKKPVVNGKAAAEDTPYAPSFVLKLSSLDPALIHPIHLAFLHEYREPTFGILSSTIQPSVSLLEERRDMLSYMVFTLDLEQKASTTILVVNGLPYDLFAVHPLPAPVGGSLLIGGNEIIYIAQSGKANGVAVNSMAKASTSFGLVDQSGLGLRLEGCTIQELSADNGELLIILNDGSVAILSFNMDGRNVTGLRVRNVDPSNGGSLLGSRVSCTSSISRNSVFIGSEEADSVILGWSRRSEGRRRSSIKLKDDGNEDEDMDDVDDDDDLYGDARVVILLPGANAEDTRESKAGDYVFRIHDSMLNIAPLRDITLARPEGPKESDIRGDLELVGVSGNGRSGALSILKREVEPNIIGRFDFPEAYGVWTMSAKKPLTKAATADKDKNKVNLNDGLDMEAQFDRIMVVSKIEEDGTEESSVYGLTGAGFEALADTEFEPAAGSTIECGTVGDGMRVIQVLRNEVRSYDGDLGLAQILAEDEAGNDLHIVAASIVDPYILLLREDASIYVAHCDNHNDLEELTREDDALLANKWLSGCLYKDTAGSFAGKDTVAMALLSTEGTLFIYSLPDLSKHIYKAPAISFLPPTISPTFAARRNTTGETITELLIADLGDSNSKTPHLILRAANDDLTIYQPFCVPSTPADGENKAEKVLSRDLHFLKLPNPVFAKGVDEAASSIDPDAPAAKLPLPMRVLHNVAGLSAVFMPGPSASFLYKSSQTIPRVVALRGQGVRSLSPFHTEGCDRGFIYLSTTGVARVCTLDSGSNYTDLGMVLKRVPLHSDIVQVAYHAAKDVFAIATQTQEPFELPRDDDYHKEWAREELEFKPTTRRSTVKLVTNQGFETIDSYTFDKNETVLCMKILNLELSEITHYRKPVLVVGTSVGQGEDLPIRGRVYIFDVIRVVPIPGRPETGTALKFLGKEEIPRGGITGLSSVGSQGFLVVAQGQKAMVRGLKEDGTLLPVAFMDISTYCTSVKSLENTPLLAFADAIKGVSLVGYAEEPYKMIVLGKQGQPNEVVCLELLPVDGELYIVVADADCNLHVLQFDPDHPKSLHGQLLLHHTTFSLGGALPTTMTLLPSTNQSATAISTPSAIFLTLSTGSLAFITPLPETTYRRLFTLSNHLTNSLYHAAGLNPKAYRINTEAPESIVGSKNILDGSLLTRWMEVGVQKRRELLGRVGNTRMGGEREGRVLREEIRALSGGLGYL